MALSGVLIIAWTNQPHEQSGFGKYIILILLVATLLWAFGTQLQKSMGAAKSPLMYSGLQMLAGAATSAVIAIIFGEGSFHFADVSRVSFLSWAYLVIFGSVIAFSAYSYLAQVVEPHLLSSYALVNPVVAVILGAVLGHEAISSRFIAASCLVLVGLCFLIYDRKPSSGR